jgi:predicted CopG family antitoxin
MSRTIIISDDLYTRLEAEAHSRGLNSVERLLEEQGRNNPDLTQRKNIVAKIDSLRERLFTRYGEMPDSVELLRDDRNR